MEEQIRNIVKQELAQNRQGNQFNVSPTSLHTHNGIDSQKLLFTNLKDVLISSVSDASVAPSDKPTNGTIRFQIDNKSGTPHWYFWSYLPNVKTGLQGWHSVALT